MMENSMFDGQNKLDSSPVSAWSWIRQSKVHVLHEWSVFRTYTIPIQLVLILFWFNSPNHQLLILCRQKSQSSYAQNITTPADDDGPACCLDAAIPYFGWLSDADCEFGGPSTLPASTSDGSIGQASTIPDLVVRRCWLWVCLGVQVPFQPWLLTVQVEGAIAIPYLVVRHWLWVSGSNKVVGTYLVSVNCFLYLYSSDTTYQNDQILWLCSQKNPELINKKSTFDWSPHRLMTRVLCLPRCGQNSAFAVGQDLLGCLCCRSKNKVCI